MDETSFANIDLVIESERDITPLVERWERDVIVFRIEQENGIWFGSFETSEGSAEKIIEKYYQLVTDLTPQLREIWDGATKKVFDIGFNAGYTPRIYQLSLSNEASSKITMMGGSITVSIYAPRT